MTVASPPAIVVRRGRDDDLPALLQLLQTSFDGWPKADLYVDPLDHLRWKLGDGSPGDTYNFVAEIDGQIVAAHFNQAFRVKAGARELVLLRSSDACVSPTFRGLSVMTQMRARVFGSIGESAHLLFGSSDDPAIARLHGQSTRLRFHQPWLVLRYPFTVRDGLSTFKLRPGRSLPKLARSLASLARWRRPLESASSQDWSIHTVDRFDERVDALAEQACAPFDFAFLRTMDVLNYRYADPRAGHFTIRLAEQDGSLLGYAVLRVTGGVGYVADLLALPQRLDVVASLARDAALQLQTTGVARAECWLMANHPYVHPVQDSGFLGRRSGTPPSFGPTTVAAGELKFLCEEHAVVHLTAGDIDFI